MALCKALWHWLTTHGADVTKEQCGQSCLQSIYQRGILFTKAKRSQSWDSILFSLSTVLERQGFSSERNILILSSLLGFFAVTFVKCHEKVGSHFQRSTYKGQCISVLKSNPFEIEYWHYDFQNKGGNPVI